MCFENQFRFFFWHFRTTALSKGLSFVLKYSDLASTFYLVQQQKTLSLPWLCCRCFKLLMLQEIHWGIYPAFAALRLMIFFFSLPPPPLQGFSWIVHRQYLFITIHGKPWLIISLSIALRDGMICYYHTHTCYKVSICDKPDPRLIICILSKWLISSWLWEGRRKSNPLKYISPTPYRMVDLSSLCRKIGMTNCQNLSPEMCACTRDPILAFSHFEALILSFQTENASRKERLPQEERS